MEISRLPREQRDLLLLLQACLKLSKLKIPRKEFIKEKPVTGQGAKKNSQTAYSLNMLSSSIAAWQDLQPPSGHGCD